MLILLAFGLSTFAFLLRYFRRRHHRKIDEKRAIANGFANQPHIGSGRVDEMWGPHQAAAHTRGWEMPEQTAAGGRGVAGAGAGAGAAAAGAANGGRGRGQGNVQGKGKGRQGQKAATPVDRSRDEPVTDRKSWLGRMF